MIRAFVPVVVLAFLGCSTSRPAATDAASLPTTTAASTAALSGDPAAAGADTATARAADASPAASSAADTALEPAATAGTTANSSAADTAADPTAATAVAEPTAVASAADTAAIHAQSRAFSDAYERGDVDAMIDIYTEDAVIFPGNMEMVKGLADLRKYWALGPGQRITHHEATPTAIHVEGDMASDYGTYEVSGIRGGEAWGPFRGKYLIVWRKDADGQWRMELDMWNARSRDAQPTIDCLAAAGATQAVGTTLAAAGGATRTSGSGTIHTACVSEVDLSEHFEGMEGTFVLYDVQNGTTRVHDRPRARERFIPASTFKIPNSLIALESGTASGADFTIAWDSTANPPQDWWPRSWRQDQTLRSALRNSVVWYYQDLARRMGEETIQRWLDRFDYGNRDIRGSTDRFWLRGPLTISPLEQVSFLDRLSKNKLGISDRTTRIVKEMLLLEEGDGYVLRGKTGTTEVTETREMGWLVGYVEAGAAEYVFALNIEGERVWEDWPPQTRSELVKVLLGELGVIPAD